LHEDAAVVIHEERKAKGQPLADQRGVDHAAEPHAVRIPVERAVLDVGLGVEIVAGLVGDDVDRAAGRVAPPERSLRTPQNVDTLDVEVVDESGRLPSREDVVDVNREARVDARPHDLAADTAQRDLRQSVAREEAGDAVLKRIEVGDPLGQQIGARKRADGLGHFLEVLAATLGLDHEHFELLVFFRGQLRSPGVGRRRSGRRVRPGGFARPVRFVELGGFFGFEDLVDPVDFVLFGSLRGSGGVALRR